MFGESTRFNTKSCQFIDEFPLSRVPRQNIGPAQKDNIRDVIFEDESKQQQQQNQSTHFGNNNNNNHNSQQQQQQPLGRRDPNAQSDPEVADQQHQWNRCRIKKVIQPERHEHGNGKKVFNQGQQQQRAVAPWDRTLESENHFSTSSRSAFTNPNNSTNQDSSDNNFSDARKRAQAQNQAHAWIHAMENLEVVGPRVGECKHLRSLEPRRQNPSETLRGKISTIASATGRCASALYQSALEGHILSRPFSASSSSSTSHNNNHHHHRTNNNAAAAAGSTIPSWNNPEDQDGLLPEKDSKGNRLRRTLPFLELAMQLENALQENIDEEALAQMLGLGNNCNESTPVTYAAFLRLFN